jgi:aspartate racemase
MKVIGIVGGIGPESTVEYYRTILGHHRELRPDGSAPAVVINSIDLQKMLVHIAANEREQLVEFLGAEVQRLARAGAECGLIAAATPHMMFNEVRLASPIPLISLVEATCDAAAKLGLKRIGLFGTRFTMQGRFFPDVFSRRGMTLVIPEPAEQDYIHQVYFGELVKGVVRPETLGRLLAIVDQMKEREKVEGLIVGGTELSLILRGDTVSGIPLLDATRIHANAIVDYALA